MNNEDFITECEQAAYHILTVWAGKINCFEISEPYRKKQFCLTATHSWGTAYCDWSDDKLKLFEALRKVGATYISGRVEWNYVCIYFNKQKNHK